MIIANQKVNRFLIALFFVSNILFWPLEFDGIWHLRVNMIIYLLTAGILLVGNRKISPSTKKLISFIAIGMSLHLLLTNFFFNEGLQEKSLISLPVFLVMIFVAYELGQISTNKDWINLEILSLITLVIAIFFILIEFLYPHLFPKQATYRLGSIFSGIYNEPSHLGFSIYPCILISLFSKNKFIFWAGIIFSVAFLYLSPSSTYLLLFITAGVITLYSRYAFHIFILALVFFMGILYIYLIWYRTETFLDFQTKISHIGSYLHHIFNPWYEMVAKENESNLSSLVYLQGWSDAIQNLNNTWGLGKGFNMMGLDEIPMNAARSIINSRGMESLNNQDGSFLFSKGVSELGLLFFMPFVVLTFKSLVILLKAKEALIKDYEIIKWLLIFSFVITSLIRSSGYFCGTFALLVFTISALRASKNGKI